MFTTLVFVLLQTVYSQDSLLLAQVIFRHGARAPIAGFTSEESRNHFFRGPGELTDEGVKQSHDLGKALRVRLVENGFLDRRYIPSEVSFRSSAKTRCLMTAAAVGSAMFDLGPSGIPTTVGIQTLPIKNDYLCFPQTPPKLLAELFHAAGMGTLSYKTMEDLMDYTLEKESLNSTYFNETGRIHMVETLPLERSMGLVVPSWFDDDAEREALYLIHHAMSFITGTGIFKNAKWIRCRTGLLLHTIMENIQQRIDCNNNTIGANCLMPKFFAYSTHDFTISSLLTSLGLFEEALQGDCPPFAAAILIELWQPRDGGEPYVKLLWRRPEHAFVPMTFFVPGCNEENCPAVNFTSCCSQYLTADPREECGVVSSSHPGVRTFALLISTIYFYFL